MAVPHFHKKNWFGEKKERIQKKTITDLGYEKKIEVDNQSLLFRPWERGCINANKMNNLEIIDPKIQMFLFNIGYVKSKAREYFQDDAGLYTLR